MHNFPKFITLLSWLEYKFISLFNRLSLYNKSGDKYYDVFVV